MTAFTVALVLVVAAAGLLRWRRPAWYWLAFGVTLAALRVLVRYRSVMEACGLTVPPARWRLSLARATNQPIPEPRPPRIRRLWPTRTGLVLRLKLCPGQDVFDIAAASDRLRHSFSMFGVTAREVRSGVVEVRMTGYDVLKRVQMPAETETRAMRVPVALREDGSVHYRDHHAVPHALTLGATESGKSVYQRNLVAGLAPLDVALVGIDCKQGVELFPLARRFSALADSPDTAAEILDALVARMADVYRLIRTQQRINVEDRPRRAEGTHCQRGGVVTVADRLLTVNQVVERLGTGLRFPRWLIEERRITFVKVGRHVRIPESAVEEYVSAHTVAPIVLRPAAAYSYRRAA
ncbi:excisionase family DNA-binding protein [Streptomyces genisteinicus]|uniref:Excisionase family DNA-binding protein n=1 Tax=Streptomyces genisteinicus TaxID=2768068 RepID=A0A7H0HUB7_9ACTN|nr:excisionase family DNA-binding protein [Streptomyces genisteinicus]